MKPNLLKLNSNTVVLEKKETNKPLQNTSIKQQTEKVDSQKQEKIKQKEKTHLENKKSLFEAFDADSFEKEKKTKFITSQNQSFKQKQIKQFFKGQDNQSQVQSQEQPQEQSHEQQHKQPQEQLHEQSHEQSQPFVKFKAKEKPRKKLWNFRFKLITSVYIIVLAVMTGWITASAARLAKVQSSIHLSDIKYAQKLKDLEKLQENREAAENSNLIPWQEIISIQPLPLEDVTEFEKQSNWFDNIINWFGNLFGR